MRGELQRRSLFLACEGIDILFFACGKEEFTPLTVTFTLDSNQTTGYRWQLEQSEELFNVITSFPVSEADKGSMTPL